MSLFRFLSSVGTAERRAFALSNLGYIVLKIK